MLHLFPSSVWYSHPTTSYSESTNGRPAAFQISTLSLIPTAAQPSSVGPSSVSVHAARNTLNALAPRQCSNASVQLLPCTTFFRSLPQISECYIFFPSLVWYSYPTASYSESPDGCPVAFQILTFSLIPAAAQLSNVEPSLASVCAARNILWACKIEHSRDM